MRLKTSLLFKSLLFSLFPATVLSSCFKDEPLNAECDIEQVYFSISAPSAVFFNDKDTLVSLSSVETTPVFHVRPLADVTSLAPHFRISPGATIEPADGVPQDFSAGAVAYTVRSEDGKYERRYEVSVIIESSMGGEVTFFDFENPYDVALDYATFSSWTDFSPSGSPLYNWSTANGGYAIVNNKANADEYPTAVLNEGYEGKGVRLTTKSTGDLGALFNKPIAAGNLFIGKFQVETALIDALSATKFGLPTTFAPVAFEGYYKYKPGDVFTDVHMNVVEGREDRGSIYAVMYRNEDDDGGSVVLDGNDVLTNSHIVATAIVDDVPAHDDWTLFRVNFTYSAVIDRQILANKGYSLAMVFSSSKDGDLFEGAVGSTLCIDSVCLVCNDYDDEKNED